jgi:hypothetical protein
MARMSGRSAPPFTIRAVTAEGEKKSGLCGVSAIEKELPSTDVIEALTFL